MRKKRFIFRWKAGTEVTPSEGDSEQGVWDFAIKWLRPAGMRDDSEAEQMLRKMGEVVEYKP